MSGFNLILVAVVVGAIVAGTALAGPETGQRPDGHRNVFVFYGAAEPVVTPRER